MSKKKPINIKNMLDNRVYDGDFLAIPNITDNKKQATPDSLYSQLNNIAMKIRDPHASTYKTNAAKKQQNNIYNLNNHNNKSNDKLYVNGWVRMTTKGILPRNFGDDINFSFLPNLTGYTHLLHKKNQYNRTTNYLMIGSILTDKYTDEQSIIWGAGMLKERTLKHKPKQVCAVRGPLTRDVLLKSGIECPEVYGDPALLMPYHYYPYIQKKYKLGIIPHHSHIKSTLLNRFKNDDEIKIIDFTSYPDWKTVIKQMLACDFIVSESLHGLIIAEAYKIPNIWVSFGEIKQDFKYEDFFRSIHKPSYESYKITENTTKEWLLSLQKKYNSTFNIDLNKLVNASPIKLKNINMNNNIRPYTGKVMLCCIAKMENVYIREFVKYYKDLGFDNICLYDNNDPDGERFEDVIEDYIKSGFVILKDVRGQKLKQIPSYTECYNQYKNKYDWIAFFDIDEFLHIDGGMNIKQFLAQDMFNDRGINCVRVCWKQFDDSGIIKPNGDYSVKKFKTFLPITKKDSVQSKVILKTQLDNVEFTSTHGPIKDPRVVCVNTAGELCENAITVKKPTWENCCLNHYRFKTIEEFVLNKMVRLWPTAYLGGGTKGLNLNMFFRYNKKTPEKVEYAEKLIKKHNISRNE